MARRRFFVEAVQDGRATLTGDDAAHLTRVLRVEVGQQFEISDNAGVWLAEIIEARKALVTFRTIEPLPLAPALPEVHLCAALFKFDRFEWLIEKATELGVSRITPVETERSERGLFAAATKRVERWRKIAREASQQSRRDTMPIVDDALRLNKLRAVGTRILLDEAPATELLQLPPTRTHPITLLLGPEGGWTADERASLLSDGWIASSLGPTVLRAETAGIAGLAVVMYQARTQS